MADNKTSIIISAVDQTGAALKSAEAGLAGLGAQAGRVSGILSGFAALAGATAFGGIIKGAIDAADELDDLAQKSGATVESLSAMKGVAKIAGADMEQVAGGLAKLSKNMVEAANGSGDAAKVLTALGVSVTDNAGKMKSTDQVMVEFAKSLQNVGSGTEKVAAAQMVLGKSGAQLLPFLNDLAAAGELQVKVTAEQAAAAANLNDNLTRLSAVHKAWANTVAMEVVPVADVFVKALLETAQGANGTKKAVEDLAKDGTLKAWAQDAAKAAGFVVDAIDGVSRVAQGAGLSLGAMAAAAAAVGSGEFSRAREVMALLVSDLDRLANKELFSDVLARRMAAIGTSAQAAAPGVKGLAAALGDAGEKAGKAAAEMFNLRLETMRRLGKEAEAELEKLKKQQEEYNLALYAGSAALESQAQSLEREVRYYGMTESAIQKTIIQRLEEARAMAAINGASEDHLLFLEREIDARRRIATASSQKEFLDTNKRAAESSAREWEKFADDINRSLTDALFRAFESGSGFGKSFADTLGNTLKAAVAKALINVAITTGSNALNSGINALLGTSGANGGNGTNYLGLANGASSIYNLGSAAYGLYTNGLNYTLGSAVSSAGSYMGSLGTQAFGAGLANGGNVGTAISLYNSAAYTAAMEGVAAQASASAAQAAGNSAAAQAAAELAASKAAESAAYTATAEGLAAGSGANSTLSALSTYVGELASGPVGWVVAILTSMYQSNKLFKEGITWGNYTDQNKDTAKFWLNEPGLIRSIMDRDLANILGKDFVNSEFHQTVSLGSLAAALTTWVNGGLFGNTGQRGSVLAGSFSEDQGGFTGRSGAQMKKTGGLFSGSKEWTDWSDLPAATDLIFDVLYASVRGGFAGLGQAFKDDALMGKMKGFEYSYSGAGTDMEAYVKDMTKQLTTAIGKTLLPSIEGLAITTEENGKKITETWNQTFQRVVIEANAVNTVFDLLGKSLGSLYGNNTDKILAASDAFVKLFGSIDAMSAAINSYYDNFYSAEEKRQRQLVQIQKRLAAGGLNFSVGEIEAASRDTFRSVADALLMQGDAGAVAFKALMDVQAAFAELHPVIDTTAQAAKIAAAEAEALARANQAAAESAAAWASEIGASLLAGIDSQQAAAFAAAEAGMVQLQRAVDLERERASAARQAAQEQITLIESLTGYLDDQITGLVGGTGAGQGASGAFEFIAQAAANAVAGYLPEQAALAEAVTAARGNLSRTAYASAAERDLATLKLAGQLAQIKDAGAKQLPVAERALGVADEQLKAAEKALDYYRTQIDELRGVRAAAIDLSMGIDAAGKAIVAALGSQLAGLGATIMSALASGKIGSADAAQRLTAAGVPTDTVTLVGGKPTYVSSQGAIVTSDGMITANTGARVSIDDARKIVAEAFYAMPAEDFYTAAKKVGLSSSMIDGLYNLPGGTALAWAKSQGLPAFAAGTNRVPADMLAILHKDEAVVPAKYNPALGGGSLADLVGLVDALTGEVRRLQAIVAEGNRHAERTAVVLDDAAKGRNPITTEASV